jgi:hypothetical protein
MLQALTAISLDSNHIGDTGAQYLAEALQHNTVRGIIRFAIS